MYYQAHDVTNTEYVEHFKVLAGFVETGGGAYGHKPGLVATQLVEQRVKPECVNTTDQRKSPGPRRHAANATSHVCHSTAPITAGISSSRMTFPTA